MKALKRISLVIVAMLICMGSANAKILRFGVKAGANFNKLSFSENVVNDINKANSSGWEAGLMLEANVPIVGLGVDLSLMYARMNNNGSIYNSQNELVYDASKNFLMLPLNIKYKLTLPAIGHYVAPYIFTGPNFMFNFDKNILKNVKNNYWMVTAAYLF